MNPKQLSRELRLSNEPDIRRRRWLLGLTIVGEAAAKVVSLYQMGMIKRLPDPPLPFGLSRLFNSTKVDKSNYAYKRADTPDALLMLLSYAGTAVLVGMGGAHRAKRTPAIPLLMLGKIIADTALGFVLSKEEWQENKALCFYCQVATLASLVSVGVALPEAIRAAKNVDGQPARTLLRRVSQPVARVVSKGVQQMKQAA